MAALIRLIDDRGSDDDWSIAQDEEDREDAESVSSVQDVVYFLGEITRQSCMVDWASCLDPLGKFEFEYEDDRDEERFRKYLTETYDIDPETFPSGNE